MPTLDRNKRIPSLTQWNKIYNWTVTCDQRFTSVVHSSHGPKTTATSKTQFKSVVYFSFLTMWVSLKRALFLIALYSISMVSNEHLNVKVYLTVTAVIMHWMKHGLQWLKMSITISVAIYVKKFAVQTMLVVTFVKWLYWFD